MFSRGTLDARNDLRKGVEISFWESNDIIIYLFGRGNTNTTESIAARTYWGRTYIEHGLDFLLHCYGYIGTTIITLIILGFVFKLKKKTTQLCTYNYVLSISRTFFYS